MSYSCISNGLHIQCFFARKLTYLLNISIDLFPVWWWRQSFYHESSLSFSIFFVFDSSFRAQRGGGARRRKNKQFHRQFMYWRTVFMHFTSTPVHFAGRCPTKDKYNPSSWAAWTKVPKRGTGWRKEEKKNKKS